jgi:predicted aconitase
MFHALGVTPEAPTLDAATGGLEPGRRIAIGLDDLARARASLNRQAGPLGAVSVGTPHFSVGEMEELARLVSGRSTTVPFYVNTSRDVLATIEETGTVEIIESFGATIVTDTCTYITPIMEDVDGVIMTNSAKWAFYAPGNLGVEVAFAGLEACVLSALTGEVDVGEEW